MEIPADSLLHNRYRVIRQLGKGGMGAVYLAQDQALEHVVAVKRNQSRSPQAAAQFLREAQLLASLRHPNLPRVIDYFLMDSDQYLVMDYIPGDDLEVLLNQVGAMPLDQVLVWTEQIISALSYLHRQNPPVVHRDIKPANLKLTPEGEVILVDFGIAKAVDLSQATSTGALGYTPGYAPPEQYGGSRTGPYTDQYSLAATLYHLLSGQKPAESVQRLLNQAQLIPLTQLRPDIPAPIAAAIERGLSVRPEDRFASVDDLQRALAAPLDQATVARAPRAAAPPVEADQTTVRRPLPTAPGAVPPPSIMPPLNSAPPPPPPASAPAAQQPPRSRRGCLIAGVVALIGLVILAALGGGGYYFYTRAQTAAATATAQALAALIPTATVEPTQTATPDVTLTPTPPPATNTPQPTWTDVAPTAVPAALGGSHSLVFVSDRSGDGVLQLWSLPVWLDSSGMPAAGEPVQLTFDKGNKQQPEFSPDGSKLVYSAPAKDNVKINGLDIWLLDLSQPGAEPIDLTNRRGDDTEAAWSPDGSLIAFVNKGRPDVNPVPQLYMMSADGSNIYRVSVDFQEYGPTWSPDAAWLVNVIYASDHRYLYRRSGDLGFAVTEGFDSQQIFGRRGEVDSPAFSPDGTTIAYTRLEGALSWIALADWKARGGKVATITSSQHDREPAWSPDGQWIAFTSERDSSTEIYVMTSTGLLQTNLTNRSGADQQPVWAKK